MQSNTTVVSIATDSFFKIAAIIIAILDQITLHGQLNSGVCTTVILRQ